MLFNNDSIFFILNEKSGLLVETKALSLCTLILVTESSRCCITFLIIPLFFFFLIVNLEFCFSPQKNFCLKINKQMKGGKTLSVHRKHICTVTAKHFQQYICECVLLRLCINSHLTLLRNII